MSDVDRAIQVVRALPETSMAFWEANQLADEVERLRGVLQSAFEDMQDNDDVGAFLTLKHECAPLVVSE